MSESVNLPALGESVTEGTVTRWLKNVGDRVEVDEPLLEVSTDKVDTEIPSPVAGVIEEILVAEDETVEVGTALVKIGDGSASADAPVEDVDRSQAGAAPAEDAPAESTESPEPAASTEPAPESEPAASTEPAPEPETAPAPAPAQAPAAEAPAAPPPAEPAPAAAPAAAESTPASPAPAAPAVPAQEAAIEEVPSNDAPAPGEDSATAPDAPAPADAVDPAPAAQAAPAQPVPATPAPSAPAAPVPATPVASSTPAPAVPEPDSTEAAAPETVVPAASGNAGYVTPLVRKLANEKGVDLSTISGTGVGGRIRKEDVLAAQSAGTPEPTRPASPVEVEVSPLRGTTVPMSRLRKVIADRAVASMQASAQLTSVVEVDVTKVAAFRTKVKDEFQQKTGVKLSFLPFFALAASRALKAFPIVNATIDTESNSIVYPAHENLSIAVDTERGLLTPVIRDAADLDLAGLAQQIADLAARTRDNKLKPDELAGGTFTLTNTGSRGALFDTPVVFLPQSAILGTGIVTKKPVVVSQDGGDAIAIRSTVYLALSYDHRIVDGADAARFLVAVKDRLESGDFSADLGY